MVNIFVCEPESWLCRTAVGAAVVQSVDNTWVGSRLPDFMGRVCVHTVWNNKPDYLNPMLPFSFSFYCIWVHLSCLYVCFSDVCLSVRPSGCISLLGMEGGGIAESQISASSVRYGFLGLQRWGSELARLNNKGLVNAWTSASYDRSPWIEVSTVQQSGSNTTVWLVFFKQKNRRKLTETKRQHGVVSNEKGFFSALQIVIIIWCSS